MYLILIKLICFLFLNSLKVIIFHSKLSVSSFSYYIFVFATISFLFLIIFNFKSRIIATGFYIIQFLYLSANYIYFSFFGIYLSPKLVYSLFEEGTITVTRGIFPFGAFLLLFLIDLPFFILILKKNVFNFFSEIKFKNKIIIFSFILLIIFLYVQFSNKDDGEIKRHQELHEEFGIVEKYGLLLWQLDLFSYEDYYLDKLQKSQNIIEGEKKEKFCNVIMIQVEALDSFIVQLEWNGNKIMPYIDKLLDSSIYYPYTLSYHFGGGTSDCEFSIINSVEPLLYYPSIKIFNYSYENSFVKILKKNNYSAKAFHGNYSSFFNRKYAFKAMGFDIFYDLRNMNLQMKGWGAPDEDLFEFVFKEIKKEDKPFFYHIITMSSHFPFVNVLNYYDNPNFHHPEREARNYFLSMSYVDMVLKKYVEEFLKVPDTYIFIYGDHTPGLYFNSKSYQPSKLFKDFKKYEFVPLIIITPDFKNYREKNLCASFLDIAPTVLDATGVKFKYSTDGQDLIKFPIKDEYFSHYDKKYKRSELYKKIDDEFKYMSKIFK